MKKTFFLYLMLSFIVYAQMAHAMRGLPTPGSLSKIISNSQEDTIIAQLHHDIDHMTSGSIIVRTFILSKRDTIAKLIQAAQRGISVNMILDGTRSENKAIEAKLKEEGIHVILFNPRKRKMTHLHSKTVLLKGKIDGIDTAKLYFGSTNLSNMAFFNRELALIEQSSSQNSQEDDLISSIEEMHRRTLEYLESGTHEQRSPVKVTPIKKRHLSDLDRPVVDSQIWRIRNARHNAHMDIVTMNLNDEAFIDEIKSALERGVTFRILINKSGVNQRTRAQLEELNNLHGIDIYIYSSELKINGKYTPIQHAKLILRRQHDENEELQTLVGIGSANFTKEARSDLNELILIPNDEDLYTQAKTFTDELAEQSTPFEDYLKKLS